MPPTAERNTDDGDHTRTVSCLLVGSQARLVGRELQFEYFPVALSPLQAVPFRAAVALALSGRADAAHRSSHDRHPQAAGCRERGVYPCHSVRTALVTCHPARRCGRRLAGAGIPGCDGHLVPGGRHNPLRVLSKASGSLHTPCFDQVGANLCERH